MKTLGYKLSYRRSLPHIQPEGATFFITFRLKGSIPIAVLKAWQDENELANKALNSIPDLKQRKSEKYKEHRRQFGRMDSYLDAATTGPTWLATPTIAQIVTDALHYRDEKVFRLDAFSVLSNHAHILMKPLEKGVGYHSLSSIMHSLKRFTALKANQILNRTGKPFWQPESYDHIVRDDAEWRRIMDYILLNPVKAGLVESWDLCPWSYCKYL